MLKACANERSSDALSDGSANDLKSLPRPAVTPNLICVLDDGAPGAEGVTLWAEKYHQPPFRYYGVLVNVHCDVLISAFLEKQHILDAPHRYTLWLSWGEPLGAEEPSGTTATHGPVSTNGQPFRISSKPGLQRNSHFPSYLRLYGNVSGGGLNEEYTSVVSDEPNVETDRVAPDLISPIPGPGITKQSSKGRRVAYLARTIDPCPDPNYAQTLGMSLGVPFDVTRDSLVSVLLKRATFVDDPKRYIVCLVSDKPFEEDIVVKRYERPLRLISKTDLPGRYRCLSLVQKS